MKSSNSGLPARWNFQEITSKHSHLLPNPRKIALSGQKKGLSRISVDHRRWLRERKKKKVINFRRQVHELFPGGQERERALSLREICHVLWRGVGAASGPCSFAARQAYHDPAFAGAESLLLVPTHKSARRPRGEKLFLPWSYHRQRYRAQAAPWSQEQVEL